MDSFILKFPPNAQFTDDKLFDFCIANDGLRIEINAGPTEVTTLQSV